MTRMAPIRSEHLGLSNAPTPSPQLERQWRVMVVSPYAHGGGHYPVFARDLSVGYARCGARVTLMFPSPVEDFDFMGDTVETVCLAEIRAELPAWLASLWPRLQPIQKCLAWLILNAKKEEWDILHWTDLDPGNQRHLWPVAMARLARLYRFRTVFSEHHPFQWRNPVSRRMHRYLSLDRLRIGDFDMIVHSNDLLQQIRRIMAVDTLGRYVPWGLWPIPASSADRAAARTALGLASDARVLLVFGWQAVYRKNLDALAVAVSQFHAKTNLTLLFVGMHKDSEPHPFKTGDWQVDVCFDPGFISEQRTRLYFEACDCVWANYRGFLGASGVMQQSMSHGRMALCQASGEIGELSRRHDLGLIVPSENAIDLKAALDQFIDLSLEDQTRYETNARQAADHYGWPMIARAILEKYPARTSLPQIA